MKSRYLLASGALVMRTPAKSITPTCKADKLTANTKNYLRHRAVTFMRRNWDERIVACILGVGQE